MTLYSLTMHSSASAKLGSQAKDGSAEPNFCAVDIMRCHMVCIWVVAQCSNHTMAKTAVSCLEAKHMASIY